MCEIVPTIKSERLWLRPISELDAVPLRALRADPLVMRFSDGTKSASQVDAWIGNQRCNPWMRSIIIRASAQVAGYCGLTHDKRRCKDDEFELGFRLAPAYWHQGCATEAASALIDAWRHSAQNGTVIAIVDPGNGASLRVLEKLGMRFRREISFPGCDHPDHLYALNRSDPEAD